MVPVTLAFTATEVPGETTDLAPGATSSSFGTFPDGILLTCYRTGPVVGIPIVQPD